MKEVVYACQHHHVLQSDGRYQVRASATGYSCGFYDSKQAAVKRAVALSDRREARERADKVKSLSCQ